MSLHESLETYRPRITSYLEDFLQEKIKKSHPEYAHLYEALHDFSTKGKLLRGCFFLLSYEMSGGKDWQRVIPIAAAIEINGSALLIHDDIIDHDLLRRGKASIYAQYIEKGKKLGAHDPQEFGVGAGIMVGDLAIILGYELLEKAQLQPHIRSKVYDAFTQDMQTTSIGQMMDLIASSTTKEPSEEEILEMYRLKTARYSLVNPFVMGAYAAEVDEAFATQVESFSEQLGIIFQIKDDEIGLMGDAKVTGKRAGSDVMENKKTLIRRYLFDTTDAENRHILDATFGNQDISQHDLDRLIAIIKSSGVQDKIQKRLDAMARDVVSQIQNLSVTEEYKKILTELTHYSLTRNK